LQKAALPGTSTGLRLQWDIARATEFGMLGGKSNRQSRRTAPVLAVAAALALALPLAGCFGETYQRGYVVPEGALEQIPIGASQEQVLILMGTPSTVATVSGEVFYYISQRAERRVAFMPQSVVDQRVVAVYFDKNRRVQRLANYGMKDGQIFDYISRTTPSGGEEINYLGSVFKAFSF
jgi:outer membrane protein assembly factor BamE (lipoprotein component of BamABCDE complex)